MQKPQISECRSSTQYVWLSSSTIIIVVMTLIFVVLFLSTLLSHALSKADKLVGSVKCGGTPLIVGKVLNAFNHRAQDLVNIFWGKKTDTSASIREWLAPLCNMLFADYVNLLGGSEEKLRHLAEILENWRSFQENQNLLVPGADRLSTITVSSILQISFFKPPNDHYLSGNLNIK